MMIITKEKTRVRGSNLFRRRRLKTRHHQPTMSRILRRKMTHRRRSIPAPSWSTSNVAGLWSPLAAFCPVPAPLWLVCRVWKGPPPSHIYRGHKISLSFFNIKFVLESKTFYPISFKHLTQNSCFFLNCCISLEKKKNYFICCFSPFSFLVQEWWQYFCTVCVWCFGKARLKAR